MRFEKHDLQESSSGGACTTAIAPGIALKVPVWNPGSAVGFSVWISRGTRIANFDFIRRRLLTVPRHNIHGVGFCRLFPTLSQCQIFGRHRLGHPSQSHRYHVSCTQEPISLLQGCCLSRSTSSFKVCLPHRPRCPSTTFSLSRVLSKLSTLPPIVTPSEVSLIVLERKLHGSPQRLMSSFVQDRTSTPSARPRSTQRGLFASRW